MTPKDADFPNLNAGVWHVTSPPDVRYNCVAFAAGRTDVYWWPDEFPDPHSDYWPAGILREESVTAFMELFQSLGYTVCADGGLEAGFEKIAIYALDEKPTHVARQLATGTWTSKLGVEEDIIHQWPLALEGPCYGRAVQYMRRAVT